MCFSATASFSSSALLFGLGTLTWTSARRPRERPFAVIPLLFAVQQFIEGVVWLSFSHDAPRLNTAMTYAYSTFSHVLWPAFVPLAALLIEPPGWRRRALAGLGVVGAAVSASLLYDMLAYGVVSHATGRHIEYVMPHLFAAAGMTLYLMATTVSLMLSTHGALRAFGALALLSFGAAYAAYATWFISVWCYFAALLSCVVLLHFRVRAAALLRPAHG